MKSGYLADVVVFDPEKIKSFSTYSHPAADPAGIAFVMKRGSIVLGSAVSLRGPA